MMLFNYHKGTEEFNDLIEEVVAFASAELNNEVIENKEERMKNLNYGIAQYCLKDTKVEGLFTDKGLEAMKDPRVIKNRDVQENFDAVIAEIINPILPMVSNKDFIRFLAEIRQVGWGDTARFIVKSNELYKVNEIANGVNRGVLEPIHDNEFTVNASPITIAAEVDFYALAAGVLDFGDFGIRAARSFENYIFLKVIAGLTSAISQFGSAYSATGFSNANWSGLAQKVSAANGGCQVFAAGTLLALNSVYPTQTGLQMGLGEKLARDGYLEKYLGVRMVVLDQALTLGTINTTATFALPDDMIYFIPVGMDKPVKLVYEGDSLVVEKDPDHTPDRTYRIRIIMRVGTGVVCGSKYAALDLTE